MNAYSDITDEQWQRVAPLLPELRPRTELRGRPLADTRAVLNGVLWIMHSGASWSAMPRRYPSYQTCHRRFKVWYKAGVLTRMIEQVLGAESEKLCALMQARMRARVPGKPKRRRGARAAALRNAARAAGSPAPAAS